MYERSAPNEYYKNVQLFESILNENGIYFVKGEETGNTFVISQPREETCKKYQLSTFMYEGKKAAHVIIFPYHSEKSMKQLASDIKRDYTNNRINFVER